MMGEISSIIETVKNQVGERESGCLSMRSERMLVAEIERLTDSQANSPAPAMLAALKAVIEWYSVTPVDEDWSPCMIQAAAAIASAERPAHTE